MMLMMLYETGEGEESEQKNDEDMRGMRGGVCFFRGSDGSFGCCPTVGRGLCYCVAVVGQQEKETGALQ